MNNRKRKRRRRKKEREMAADEGREVGKTKESEVEKEYMKENDENEKKEE